MNKRLSAKIACALPLAVMLGSVAVGKTQAPAAPLSTGPHDFNVGKVRLWYRVAGSARALPIIFLHGGPGEGSQVFQQVGGPQLEHGHRIVYFDQRGAGRSDRPSDPANYSLSIMVDDIEQLRRQLGVPKIVLLGHSFGTQLALEYAARYPEHIAAIILAGATPDLLRSIDLQCERLAKDDPAAYARAAAGIATGTMPRCNTMVAYSGDAATAFANSNLFPDSATAARVERIENGDGLGSTGESARALFSKGLLTYRFTKVSAVLAPVLIIAGGKDFQAALEPQRDLARALPRARLIEYPTCGHFMFVEDPVRFARDIAGFLDRLPTR